MHCVVSVCVRLTLCVCVCVCQTAPNVDSHCHGNMLQTPLQLLLALLLQRPDKHWVLYFIYAPLTTHHLPASPWFPCFSSLPPFAYHPFISISALLRGANCTKFAQVPPKCTMKMNNYVYEFSSLLLLIIPSCRLVCLIKCLRGSDKNIFLITEYTNLQLWARN